MLVLIMENLQQKKRDIILKTIEKFGRENGYPIILESSANVLIDCIKNHNPENILEIGSCIGYSASLMINALSEKARLTTIEVDENSASIARRNFQEMGFADRIKLIVGDAKNVILELNEKYDFIFLDGPKGQYKNYLPTLKKLLANGGILFADNIYFKGYVLKPAEEVIPRGIRAMVNNLREYIRMLSLDDELETDFLDIGDGVSISRKIKENENDWIISTGRE